MLESYFYNACVYAVSDREETILLISGTMSLKESKFEPISGEAKHFHTFEDSDEKISPYSICQFLVNGEAILNGFKMKGDTVRPTIFQDPEIAIQASLVYGELKRKRGAL